MLRGINRSIIEINDTDNRYFEKVLIFVRPEFGSFPEGYLKKEAKKMVGSISTSPVGLKKRIPIRKKIKLKRKRILAGVLLGLAGAAVLYLVSIL